MKIQKCWHTKDYRLVWQGINSHPNNPSSKDKIYLVIDCSKDHDFIYIGKEKNTSTTQQSNILGLLRKNIRSAFIKKIFRSEASGDYWIPLSQNPHSEASWYLYLQGDKPVELSLICVKEKTTYFRYSKRGSYTKKKDFENSFPSEEDEDLINILPELLKLKSSSVSNKSPENPPLQEIPSSQKEAFKRLQRRRKTLRASLNKVQKQEITPVFLEEEKQKADLLKEQLHLVKPEMSSITLEKRHPSENKLLQITLDPQKTPGQNLQAYYKKNKQRAKALEINQEQTQKIKSQLENLEDDLKLLKSGPLPPKKVEETLKNHHISPTKQTPRNKKSPPSKKPWKTFQLQDGETIFVGKSATENDQLTKQAKSHDYWFHAVGVTGSHVIVPIKALPGKKLSNKTKKAAAILAIYYSPLKEDLAGEVYCSRRAHLTKRKGMPPGLWHVSKSENFYIRFKEDELKEVLNTMVQ